MSGSGSLTVRLCVLVLMLATAAVARAQDNASCAVSANNLAFGSYAPDAPAPIDSDAEITLVCNADTGLLGVVLGFNEDFQITLDPGSAGNFNPRSMGNLADPGQRLAYNLFADSARSLIWGDGTSGTVVVNGNINNGLLGTLLNAQETRDFTVFGRVFALQDVRTGDYSDSIVVTVIFQ